jgi:MSHA biogenesis protein MshL
MMPARIHHYSLRCATTALLILFVAMLAGCANPPARWKDDPKKEIASAMAEASKDDSTVPPDISQAMLPPLRMSLPNDDASLLEPHFDLTANKTPARQVFMSLVQDTPYSMVVHPDVSGTISLHLKDVTVPEAVETLRQVYGYDYRREGKRFFIKSQGLETRMFPVNYLNLERKGISKTQVSSGGLTDSKSDSSNSSSSSSSGSNAATQTPSIEVQTLSDSNFWKELATSLETIIGKEDGRRVVVQPQAGLVIVRAMPDELDMVQRFLGITQATVNRQVSLEAKIIEVDLNNGFQTGINWAGLGSVGNTNYLMSQTGGGTLLNSGVSDAAGSSGNLQPDNGYTPVPAGKVSAFGGIFSLAIRSPNFAAFLELLQTQGSVHVLSSPRVSTVNNQKAVIKVGGDEFFVTGITNTATTSGATTTQAPTVELTPFFSGIALDVTPQIDADNHVTLHIHPTVSEVTQRDKNFVVSGESFSLPLAISTIQESDNVVRANTGQIIVIGGLMKEATTEDSASVPLLGDVPVIGNLFKHQRLTRIKKELVILLKPTVMDDGANWAEAIQPLKRRTNDLMGVRDR